MDLEELENIQIVRAAGAALCDGSGEPTQAGWISWVKTWCLDFVSTYQVYWNVPGDTLDVSEAAGAGI